MSYAFDMCFSSNNVAQNKGYSLSKEHGYLDK